MKVCQLVIGPAGSGKSTFCETMKNHCDAAGRVVHVVNLDPAAEDETITYPVSIDIRELISLEDAMEECGLGPNGGLLFCLEYLEENVEWLMEALEPYSEDDYLLVDCPGQIEAYSHLSVFRTVVGKLQSDGWTVGCVYCLDAQFSEEASKFVAGSLNALTAMVNMELPHVNVMTKMDLVRGRGRGGMEGVERNGSGVDWREEDDEERELIIPDRENLLRALNQTYGKHLKRFARLNEGIVSLLDEWSLIGYVGLDVRDEHSVAGVLMQLDFAVGWMGDEDDVRGKYDQDALEEADYGLDV